MPIFGLLTHPLLVIPTTHAPLPISYNKITISYTGHLPREIRTYKSANFAPDFKALKQ